MGERLLSHCLLLTKLMLQHKHTPSRSFYFQRAWLVSAEQKKEVKHGLDIYSQRLFKGYIQFQMKTYASSLLTEYIRNAAFVCGFE